MIRSLFLISFFVSLSNAAGTYDSYYFDDTQEKYSLHFVNTALTTELTGSGLASADATVIIGLRPITSLATVAANANVTGKDMLYIRERSAAISIPDQSIYSDMNTSLGITNREKNFLSSLSGVLFGFTFMFASVLIASRR